jgi:hypothetical protein
MRKAVLQSRDTSATAAVLQVQPAPMRDHAPADARYNGNQAALRRLSGAAPALQCKLEIGAVNDPLEAEADRVADQVMRMPDGEVSLAASPRISRKCQECEEEEKHRGTVFTKREGAAAREPAEVPASVYGVLDSPGEPLAQDARDFFEPRLGRSLADIRIHAGSQAHESAQAVHAVAYTVGRDIVFTHGRFDPGSISGRRLLAHELTHAVQQGAAHSESASTGKSGSVEPPGADGSSAVIRRSESVHPEEQMCEDLLQNPGAQCSAIIACINELIEALAGRFSQLQPGDEGHWQRITIVQRILGALMTLAMTNCKNGEYDQELQDEAEKWRDKKNPNAKRSVDWDTVAKVVLTIGLGIATVAVVIAALADPEPASKLALAGLSVEAIEALGAALGFATAAAK